MTTVKKAFSLSKESYDKLVLLSRLLNKNKSRFISDLIAEKYNETDKKQLMSLITQNIDELNLLFGEP